jgi:hypothetical protein
MWNTGIGFLISWIRLADLNPCTCTMYISLTIFLFRSGIAFYFHLFSTVQVTVRPKKKCVCLWSHVKKTIGPVVSEKITLKMVQHRAARFVTNRQRNTSSVGDMLQHLNWDGFEMLDCIHYDITKQDRLNVQ